MCDFIVRCLTWAASLLLPPNGRHRAPRPGNAPTLRSAGRPARSVLASTTPRPARVALAHGALRGEDNALVRPYLTAYERHLDQWQTERLRGTVRAWVNLNVAEVG